MDNNSEELRLKDALWFADELGKLTAEDQNKVFQAKTIDQMREIYGGDAPRLLRGREAWQIESSLGNRIEIPTPRTTHVEPAKNQNLGKTATEGIVSGAGLGIMGSALAFDRIRNREYNKFKKERDKFTEDQVKKWKENPDETYAKSEIGARNRAINEFHDKKLSENPEKVTKWAEKHKDPDIQKAIKRKEILGKDNPRRTKKELDKFLEEREIKHPEKTHTDSGTIQNEASARLEESARIGQQNKKITPESTTKNLETLQKNTNQAIEESNRSQLFIPDPRENIRSTASYEANEKTNKTPSVQGVMDEIKEIEKELEFEQKKEEKPGGAVRYSKPQPQPRPQGPAEGSSSSSASRRPYGGLPLTYRKAQRFRRRFGPGGVSKGVGRKVAKKGAKRVGMMALGWLGWVGIAVIAVIILIIVLIFVLLYAFCNDPFWGGLGRILGTCPAPYSVDVPPNAAGVTTQKVGPSISENGQVLSYRISVTYDPEEATVPIEELNLYDVPLFGFNSPSSNMPVDPRTDQAGNSFLVFPLKDNPNCITSLSCEFELSLAPTDEDFFAINAIYVRQAYEPVNITYASGSSEDGGTYTIAELTEGRNEAPSNNTCGGDWNVKNHPNFGDPVCSYTPAKFSAYIEEVETNSKNWSLWEDISISEGSTNRIGGGINVLGDGGAGTFQMIPGTGTIHNHGPGNWPGPAGEIGYDGQRNVPHGDVTWQRQIEQAVGWNNYTGKNGDSFMYWGTAYCLCYFDSYRNSGVCDDILDNKATRCPQECHPGGNYVGSCSVNTDRLAEKRGNSINCNAYRCNIGLTGRDDNTDKNW